MIEIEIPTRVISKKNSRRIGRNPYTGRIFNTPSNAYEIFKMDCQEYLADVRNLDFDGPFLLNVDYEVKGKSQGDLDNAITSVLDILQDYHVITNDKNYKGTDHQRITNGHKNYRMFIKLIPLD